MYQQIQKDKKQMKNDIGVKDKEIVQLMEQINELKQSMAKRMDSMHES